ncbi:MAG TPA: hypothetical protein VJC01_00580 [Candidatus Paceibacterota bacterium]
MPRHTARILGGQNPKKKNVLSILEKITPAKIRKSKEHFFFLGLPSGARRRRGFHWLGIFDKVSSSEVVKTLQKNSRLNFAKVFLEPMVGLEPTTCGLRYRCSTSPA